MSGFSAEWLALREPVDHSARSDVTLAGVSGWFARDNQLNITDIGSGTGSTLRALKPILHQTIKWHLVDNDDALLDVAKREALGDRVDFSLADLSDNLNPLFSHSPDLITTSAFLDLVSESWLENMVREVTKRKIPFYAALTYDGRAECEPRLEDDNDVLEAFNAHQKTDKGFGPALGPQAADHAINLFREAGYQVSAQESDWIGNSKHKRFQIMLLEGWYEAAIQIEPDQKKKFQHWLQNRISLVENSDASLFVGHKDFFAVPA
jgi:SAM-dependent methyltransferase